MPSISLQSCRTSTWSTETGSDRMKRHAELDVGPSVCAVSTAHTRLLLRLLGEVLMLRGGAAPETAGQWHTPTRSTNTNPHLLLCYGGGVSYRELFTAGWFGVREKHYSRLKIYDRLRVNEQTINSPMLISGLLVRSCHNCSLHAWHGILGPCLDCKFLQSGHCSTFRLYLTNFVWSWTN